MTSNYYRGLQHVLWMQPRCQELNFIILFVVPAASVVPCGGPKKKPRTSYKAQFIFYLWDLVSMEIFLEIVNTIIGLDSYILNRFLLFKPLFDLYQSLD